MDKNKNTIGKRDFIQHTSKYLKIAEKAGNIVITHQKKPQLCLYNIKKKSIKDLRGIIKQIKCKGDINDPVLPEYTEW